MLLCLPAGWPGACFCRKTPTPHSQGDWEEVTLGPKRGRKRAEVQQAALQGAPACVGVLAPGEVYLLLSSPLKIPSSFLR